MLRLQPSEIALTAREVEQTKRNIELRRAGVQVPPKGARRSQVNRYLPTIRRGPERSRDDALVHSNVLFPGSVASSGNDAGAAYLFRGEGPFPQTPSIADTASSAAHLPTTWNHDLRCDSALSLRDETHSLTTSSSHSDNLNDAVAALVLDGSSFEATRATGATPGVAPGYQASLDSDRHDRSGTLPFLARTPRDAPSPRSAETPGNNRRTGRQSSLQVEYNGSSETPRTHSTRGSAARDTTTDIEGVVDSSNDSAAISVAMQGYSSPLEELEHTLSGEMVFRSPSDLVERLSPSGDADGGDINTDDILEDSSDELSLPTAYVRERRPIWTDERPLSGFASSPSSPNLDTVSRNSMGVAETRINRGSHRFSTHSGTQDPASSTLDFAVIRGGRPRTTYWSTRQRERPRRPLPSFDQENEGELERFREERATWVGRHEVDEEGQLSITPPRMGRLEMHML